MSSFPANEEATVRVAEMIYGSEPIPFDDPAETYHEASKSYPSFDGRLSEGVRRLEASPQLQRSALRSVLRHETAPRIPLPEPLLPVAPLSDVLSERASCRSFTGEPIDLTQLSALLHGCYGVTRVRQDHRYRTVPSGGALYPLEVYAVVRSVRSLERGLYHFDPHRRVLEVLRADATSALEQAVYDPEMVRSAAVTLIISCLFWRSRFKYRQRGYRFSLLEAGHAMQNLLLVARALDLGAVPIGGFYDARVDEIIGADGVEHSSLYLAPVGVATIADEVTNADAS